MKTTIFKTALILALVPVFFSCDSNETKPAGEFDNGVFITNEGAFGGGNASVSFYSLSGDSIVNNIFSDKNNRPLGDVLQSALTYNGKTYLVLNASNKIEIVNTSDFEEQGVIESLESPRYIIEEGGLIYVTQWGEGGVVKVIDPATKEVTTSIPAGTGPESILSSNGYVVVANSGGYGEDSTITVINAATNQVEKTIKTGTNPKDMVIDGNGDLWVLNTGSTIYDENWAVIGHKPSSLAKVSMTTLEVLDTYPLYDEQHPGHLEANPSGNMLYIGGGYGFGGIFLATIADGEIASTPIINVFAYGFKVNSTTNEIYVFEAPNFTDSGMFYRYSLAGTPINDYEVGIGPNGAAF